MTIKDIAQLADVSVATVSKVMNGKDENISKETRDKINHIIVENNYVPYRNVLEKATTSKLIALLISDVGDIFCAELLRGVEDYCFTKGYSVVVCSTDGDEKKERKYIHQMTKQNVQGIIRFPVTGSNEKGIQRLADKNIYNVILDDSSHTPNSLRTLFNNKGGAYLAVEHLICHGHTQIGYLSPVSEKPYMKDRWAGYLEALESAHIPLNSKLVYQVETDNRNQCGYDGAKYMMAQGATAIFCTDDHVAVGAYRAIQECGKKIPDDISIVGFDDTMFCQLLNPPLTSIRQSAYEIGRRSAKLLYQKMGSTTMDGETVQIEPQLIKRSSVAGPGGSSGTSPEVHLVYGDILAQITLDVSPVDSNGCHTANTATVKPGGLAVEKAISLLSEDKIVYLLGSLGNDTNGKAVYQQLQGFGISVDGLHLQDSGITGTHYITKQSDQVLTSVVVPGSLHTLSQDDQWIFQKATHCHCPPEIVEELSQRFSNISREKNITIHSL